MGDPSGDLLYVELSASEVRRRVKGFGHGVRKVQSAGRGRTAIIHTAVGRHLEELKRLFGEVMCSDRLSDLDPPVTSAEAESTPPLDEAAD